MFVDCGWVMRYYLWLDFEVEKKVFRENRVTCVTGLIVVACICHNIRLSHVYNELQDDAGAHYLFLGVPLDAAPGAGTKGEPRGAAPSDSVREEEGREVHRDFGVH